MYAFAASGQPYYIACRHIFLQRRPQYKMDSFQLSVGHYISNRHRCQLSYWYVFVFYSLLCTTPLKPPTNILSSTPFYIFIFFFFSGIMQQDNAEQVILDPKIIAKNYLKTWFFLDLISSIPLDYIFLIFNQVSWARLGRSLQHGVPTCVLRFVPRDAAASESHVLLTVHFSIIHYSTSHRT